jgi:hypothetical protein
MSSEDQWKTHKNEIEKILSEIKTKEDEVLASIKIAKADLNPKIVTISGLCDTLRCLIGPDADSDLDLVVSDLEGSNTNLSDMVDALDGESDISYNCDEVSRTMAELEQNPDRRW